MKSLLLILLLALPVSAQTDWKLIKEMSGEIPGYTNLHLNLYAARIARGDEIVKLLVRADFPDGAPWDAFRDNAPHDFDVSSISRMEFKVEFNCTTGVADPKGGGDIYQFNGRHFKSKEAPIRLSEAHIFSQYFCERGLARTKQAP